MCKIKAISKDEQQLTAFTYITLEIAYFSSNLRIIKTAKNPHK
jgi:hypothetical protein